MVDKIIKAINIKMKLNRLSFAKENAMREFLGLPPRTTWYEECSTTVMECVKDKCCHIFFPCCLYDRNRRLKRLTCWDSPIFKDFIGFVGGVILTGLVYLLLVYHMNLPPVVAFAICTLTSIVLTTVMAFSDKVRCLVLLMLPQFFSGKGRLLLLMYALYLAVDVPLKNMNHNITVMSQSSTCGQEMALNGTKDLVKAASAPIQSVISSVEEVIQKLQDFSNGLRDMYVALEKSVGQITGTIREALEWVTSMGDRCKEKVSSPYKMCRKMFSDAKSKCEDKLPFLLSLLCKITDVLAGLCNIVKVASILCEVAGAIQKLVKSNFDLPGKQQLQRAKEMFFFNTSIKYNFNYTFTQSKSYSDIRDDIQGEIDGRLDSFMWFIDIFRNFLLLGILIIVGKAMIYRFKWLSVDRYDNIYITFPLRDLDERRKAKGKPSILPLNYDEECKYISSLSGFMIMKEKKQLAFGLVIFLLGLINAAFYLFCDFALWSVLVLIETHFSVQSKIPIPPHTKLHVSGAGPMSDMYRSIVTMFDPLTSNHVQVDVTPCVPHPAEPKWDTYKLIAAIFFICLILTITEAYGLRARHIIMACYFPRRERKRAIWLFNHILKTRGGILTAAKKNMNKFHTGELAANHISLKGRLAANYPLCEKILKWFGWEVKCCLYCGREGKPDDYFNFIHCAYYDCDAVYCLDCFADLDNQCAVCMKAVEVKGSGASEEVDSSQDEREKMLSEAQKVAKSEKIKSIQLAQRPSRQMADIRAQLGLPFGDNTPAPIDTREKSHAEIRVTVESSTIDSSSDSASNSDSSSGSDDSDGDQNRNSVPAVRTIKNHWFSNKAHWYSRNISNNANYTRVATDSTEFDCTDTERSELSDLSSVCSDDLDYSYQDEKNLDIAEVSDYENYVVRKRSKGLDLVPEDEFADSESCSDDSEVSAPSEPHTQFLFRI